MNKEAMPGVLIVTGGGRGIGAAIAIEAGRLGYKVCVNYSRSQKSATAVVAQIRDLGAEALAIQADVGCEHDVKAMFEEVDRTLGSVTVMINNAGIMAKTAIADFETQTLKRVMAVNVHGVFLCARESIQRMSSKHGGSGGVIVNISSISAKSGGGPRDVIYAASKGAIDTFTIGLAKEVAQEGIRVCAVRPGMTETDIFDDDRGLDGARALAREIVPLGRMAKPAEIAGLVLWLCSPAASYITGALYDVSGGR